MKKDAHPKTYPAIFVDTSCGAEFVTTSTLESEQERTVDGVSYKLHLLEISSASHPFYTGKQVLVDTARRAEKFQDRVAKTEGAAAARKGKKAKKAKGAAKKEAKKSAPAKGGQASGSVAVGKELETKETEAK